MLLKTTRAFSWSAWPAEAASSGPQTLGSLPPWAPRRSRWRRSEDRPRCGGTRRCTCQVPGWSVERQARPVLERRPRLPRKQSISGEEVHYQLSITSCWKNFKATLNNHIIRSKLKDYLIFNCKNFLLCLTGSWWSEKTVEGVGPAEPVRVAGYLLLSLLLGSCELGLHLLPDHGLGHGTAEPEAGPHGVWRPRLPHRLAPHGLVRQQFLLLVIFLLTTRSPKNNQKIKLE